MLRSFSPLVFTSVAFVLGVVGPIGLPPGPSPVATTKQGEVQGIRGPGFQAFLGIPYAAPPVGPRRWERPAPPEPWEGVRDAKASPPRCAQTSMGLPLSSQEDCLYLNVHTPDPRPKDAPVMVWIHGGSFTFGEGLQTDGGTAGDVLARRFGVVVVSMNYRLGPFGFFAHPEREDSGNLGLADQVAALRWVKENIAEFGGDPDNVTIFGESAGGISVCAHLVSPEAEGLFHRAIVQSGSCDRPMPTEEQAVRDALTLASRLGCDGPDAMACLRSRPMKAILGASKVTDGRLGERRAWRPYIDGVILPASIRERIERGAFHRVPVIVGWNGDEGSLDVLFARLAGKSFRYDEVTKRLSRRFGVSLEAIRKQYPPMDDPSSAIARALGDALQTCPARRFARTLAAHGADVYTYRFLYPNAGFQIPFVTGLGAFHSADIQYVFGHPAPLFSGAFGGDDRTLNDAMAGAWTEFARTGAPPKPWPRFDLDGEMHLVFDRQIGVERGADADACALWE